MNGAAIRKWLEGVNWGQVLTISLAVGQLVMIIIQLTKMKERNNQAIPEPEGATSIMPDDTAKVLYDKMTPEVKRKIDEVIEQAKDAASEYLGFRPNITRDQIINELLKKTNFSFSAN